jgi:hypothetical protein
MIVCAGCCGRPGRSRGRGERELHVERRVGPQRGDVQIRVEDSTSPSALMLPAVTSPSPDASIYTVFAPSLWSRAMMP